MLFKSPSPVTVAIDSSLEYKNEAQDLPSRPKAVCLRQWTGDIYSHNDSSAFLIKPAQAIWDSDSALSTLNSLAQQIVPYITKSQISPKNDPLCKFLKNHNFKKVESYDGKLLLILHILMRSESFLINLNTETNKFAKSKKSEPYIRTINDVFLGLVFICDMLLNQDEDR